MTIEHEMPSDPYDSVAQFYDHVVPYMRRADVAFFVEAAKEFAGPVLELGCGTGRVLIPLARDGVEVFGLDSSSSMLSVCRTNLSRESQEVQSRVQLREADMRNFEIGSKFRLVTIPFRPFQHLISVEDQLACLASVHRHLEDGGRMILDLFNPDLRALVDERRLAERGDEPEFQTADGRRVLRRERIAGRDLFNQVQDCELIYHVTESDGRTHRVVHSFRLRHLFRFEAEHLLARSGFLVEQLYSDYDRSPYGSKYPGELIFVARKG